MIPAEAMADDCLTAEVMTGSGAVQFYEHRCGCGCGGAIPIKLEHRRNRIPRFLARHQSKTGFDRWVEENRGKHLCACGCGEAFVPTREHRRSGFPPFKRGHAMKVAHAVTANVAAWVREHQGQHRCACGCGQAIRIHPAYRWEGIPQFVRACFLRLRIGENHPNWLEDRAAAPRSGRYFLPRIRREILERDGFRCHQCGSTDRLAIDHVVPVAEGGEGTAANGQALCHGCHATKTRTDRTRRASVQNCERDR